MKKILYLVLAALAALTVSCGPQATPEEPDKPGTETEPGTDPGTDVQPKDNVIYFLNKDGKVSREIAVKSATSFVYNGGYFSFYLGSMDGLTPDAVADGFEPAEGESIVAAAILNSFNGKKVVLKEEKLRHVFQARIDGLEALDASENEVSEEISAGWFILSVDKEELEAVFEFELSLKDGSTVKARTVAEYVPGGENDNFVILGDDYERPLRVGFYDDPFQAGFEPTLYMAVGEIEYGEDLPRTTYVGLAASSDLCDGQPHHIPTCIENGKLAIMFYSIEGHLFWDVTDGELIINKSEELGYEISISAGHATDEDGESANTPFEMYWKGGFKDITISRPIYSQLEYNGETIALQSAVIEIGTDLGHVYLCPSEGITTVEAAKADNPLVITLSASKVFMNVGLSTDRENFSISYDGNTWDKNSLDTCSYIVHDRSDDMFHCQIASFGLKEGNTRLKLEYKGPLTVIGL